MALLDVETGKVFRLIITDFFYARVQFKIFQTRYAKIEKKILGLARDKY